MESKKSVKMIGIDLPLYKSLKIAAAITGDPQTEIVRKALQKYLSYLSENDAVEAFKYMKKKLEG